MNGFDPSDKVALYRLYDEHGALLYVGVTNELRSRLGAHKKTQSWWPSVHSRRIEWYDDRNAAEAAERLAMRDEHPIWNDRDSPWKAVVTPGRRVAVTSRRDGKTKRSGDRHKTPGTSMRLDTARRAAAELELKSQGWTLRDFVDACFALVVADSATTLDRLGPFKPLPRPRGRPRKTTD